jgi:hypothetical protein
MKKLIVKDHKLRLKLKAQSKCYFVLKTIYQNSNLPQLIRWNAYFKLDTFGSQSSIVSTSSKCIYTKNKKRFNKIAPFSRHIFLKLIRFGKLSGIKKNK